MPGETGPETTFEELIREHSATHEGEYARVSAAVGAAGVPVRPAARACHLFFPSLSDGARPLQVLGTPNGSQIQFVYDVADLIDKARGPSRLQRGRRREWLSDKEGVRGTRL